MPRANPPQREPGTPGGFSAQAPHRGPRRARRLDNTRRAARELLDQLLGRTDRGLPR